jgi:hypothetical protein
VSVLPTSTRPPCVLAIFATVARPIPDPGVAVFGTL